LQRLDLYINSRDFATLQDRYLLNDYYTADMVFRGQRVRNVGVRSRGSGSRNREKLGLRVDFNRFTKGQQFVGLDSIVLDNLRQDKALIRENLAMSIYRRVGQVAPRESLCRLYINNQFYGLYGIVESIEDGFVKRNLGETGGYLYEYKYPGVYLMKDLGDDLTVYARLFEPQNHDLESNSQLYQPIRDLIKEINGPDRAVWLDRVKERIDIPQFMQLVAVQQFTGEDDGILGSFGINNFYLYRFTGTTRHRLLPWDEDHAVGFINADILRHNDSGFPVLFARAYDTVPEMRSVFLDMVERCANSAEEDNWLAKEIERLVALIGPRDDPHNQFTLDEYLADIEALRGFARTQPQSMLEQVARERAR
jgi:spore coat protein CotH